MGPVSCVAAGDYPAAHAAMTREIVAGHTLVYTWRGTTRPAPQSSDGASRRGARHTRNEPDCATVRSMASSTTARLGPRLSGQQELADRTVRSDRSPGGRRLRTRRFRDRRERPRRGGRRSGAAAAAALLRTTASTPSSPSTRAGRRCGFPVARATVALIASPRRLWHAPGDCTCRRGTLIRPHPRRVSQRSHGPCSRLPNAVRIAFPGTGGHHGADPGARAGFAVKLAVANEWLFEPLLIRQIAATPAGAASLHTTIAPTMLRAAQRKNVLPQDAAA